MYCTFTLKCTNNVYSSKKTKKKPPKPPKNITFDCKINATEWTDATLTRYTCTFMHAHVH